VSYGLIFNSVDVSAPVIGNGIGSGLTIANDQEFIEPGIPLDGLGFQLQFPSPFPFPGGPGDLILVGLLSGPTSMFDSTALPASLDFLGQLLASVTIWAGAPHEGDDCPCPLDVQGALQFTSDTPAVPEPSTISLVALSLVGALARARYVRRSRT
jgi:hypothetical protein